ncbi:hypothetical protein GGI42DRAFT_92115 [Trichoderma sp. SZMC 28013]
MNHIAIFFVLFSYLILCLETHFQDVSFFLKSLNHFSNSFSIHPFSAFECVLVFPLSPDPPPNPGAPPPSNSLPDRLGPKRSVKAIDETSSSFVIHAHGIKAVYCSKEKEKPHYRNETSFLAAVPSHMCGTTFRRLPMPASPSQRASVCQLFRSDLLPMGIPCLVRWLRHTTAG